MLRLVKWVVATKAIFLAPILVGLVTWAYSLLAHRSSAQEPPPFLFSVWDIGAVAKAHDLSPQSFDFRTRPLFLSERMPPANFKPEPVPADPQPAVVLAPLDGMTLIGVFGSNTIRGIIVRPDGEASQRLLAGELLNGWEFRDFDGRRANFVDPANRGRSIYLDLKFRVVSPLPTREDVNPSPEQAANRGTGASEKAPAQEPGAVGFGAMYRDRARRRGDLETESDAASDTEVSTNET